jgi:hypothetical protein
MRLRLHHRHSAVWDTGTTYEREWRSQDHSHDTEKARCGGRLRELPRDDLDAVLDVDRRDVEPKGIAREAGDVFEPLDSCE